MGSHICQHCGDQMAAIPEYVHYCRARSASVLRVESAGGIARLSVGDVADALDAASQRMGWAHFFDGDANAALFAVYLRDALLSASRIEEAMG